MRVVLALPLNIPQMSITGSSQIPPSLSIPRCGGWLPEDTWILRTWLSNLVSHVDSTPKPLHAVIRETQTVIEDDPVLYMLFHDMFNQIPLQEAYARDPFGSSQIRDYKHLLRLINEIITRAPLFADSELIGLPLNALLDWPMFTPAGQTAFLSPKLNAQFSKVLDVWASYLSSPASASVLNESQTGWLGPPALTAIRNSTSSRRTPQWSFESTFVCNPHLKHFGFTSWDDFFTRRFRPGVRPIASPLDSNVIVNPCECSPYRIYRNVRRVDRFWIKAQPYSLDHMLAHDKLGERFVGGTIYQAFLDAVNYHRWHAPVTGVVKSVRIIPGTYFSQVLGLGVPRSEVNVRKSSGHSISTSLSSKETRNVEAGLGNVQCANQAYAAAVATRAVIMIDTDNPVIGMIALVFVGMAEVSTCDVQVVEGQRLKKGDNIGTFRYGGSSVCMVIRRGIDLVWDLHGQDIGLGARTIAVNARIAKLVVKKEEKIPRTERRRNVKARTQKEAYYGGWRGEALGM